MINVTTALQTIDALDAQHNFSIIKLSEPLLLASEEALSRDAPRTSDASSIAPQSDVPTPASLEADLTHYKVSRSCSKSSSDIVLTASIGTLY